MIDINLVFAGNLWLKKVKDYLLAVSKQFYYSVFVLEGLNA